MAQAETIPTTTRRGFLSGAGAAAVLPAAAAPQLIDPIFAVIERHRSAFREFVAASLAVDEVKALRDGREITQEAEDRLDAAVEANEEAADLLTSTAPTTMAGLAAAVAWLLEYDEGCIPDTSGQFLRTLASSPLMVVG